MGKETFGRSFKSGNSVAIRIPAEFKVEPGLDWIVAQGADGGLVLRKREDGKQLRNAGLREIYGAIPGIERLAFDERDHSQDW